mgnify:CR=1 FL=1
MCAWGSCGNECLTKFGGRVRHRIMAKWDAHEIDCFLEAGFARISFEEIEMNACIPVQFHCSFKLEWSYRPTLFLLSRISRAAFHMSPFFAQDATRISIPNLWTVIHKF